MAKVKIDDMVKQLKKAELFLECVKELINKMNDHDKEDNVNEDD